MTKLIDAAKKGDVKRVRELLTESGKKDSQGKTALMYAAENGHIDCVQVLADEEAKMTSDERRTALMCAAKNGHVAIVEILRDKEGGLQDIDGWTALMSAAKHGHINCIELLLNEAKVKTKKKVDSIRKGSTALIIATYYNKVEAVKILSSREREIKDTEDHDALWYATSPKIKRGKPRNSDDSSITSIIKILSAPSTVNKPTLKKNLVPGEEIRPSPDATPDRPVYSTSEVETVYPNEESRDQIEKPTRTRLMIAAYHGRVDDIEKYLKQAGRQDYRHLTALMYAIIAGHTECVRLLAPLEAHIQMPDGWTALREAIRQDNDKVVKILLEEGKGQRMYEEVKRLLKKLEDQKYVQLLSGWLEVQNDENVNKV
ncbi:Ankyrin repeat protein 1 [Giardia muris]|uniref:Ankyrin repeat protein 1 n=1 Tax=Giardia muris TaxID=5742 RepID=A0A4Z1SRU4_GIAMU|nr:Ankyrin repeat protein 1 [Giardia muris]|eukprot:TNJ28470.1 Ankyrin repeat protein 1 [Giardia muris]